LKTKILDFLSKKDKSKKLEGLREINASDNYGLKNKHFIKKLSINYFN
jgi:hypothetical protein